MRKLLISLLVFFPNFLFSQGIRISDLPETNTVTPTAITVIVDNGATYKITVTNLNNSLWLAIANLQSSLSNAVTYITVTNALGLTGSTTTFLRSDGTQVTITGSGDVVGPGLAVDNAITRFDLTTGKLIKNSVVLVGNSGIITGVNSLTVTNTVTASDFIAGATNFVTALSTKAEINSQTFTGDPKVPNVVLSDSDTTIANTAFVKSNITAIVASDTAGTVHSTDLTVDNAVMRVDGTTGTNAQKSVVIIGDSGIMTGVNSLTVTNSVTASDFTAGSTNFVAALALKAALAGPVFTGDPQVPNVVLSDSDTTIANTAFVKSNITAIVASDTVGTVHSTDLTVDNAIMRVDGTTGTNAQKSVVIIGDSGIITGVNSLTVTNTVTASDFIAGTTNFVSALSLKAPLTDPAFTGSITVQKDALGVNTLPGVIVTNSTAATSGNQQYSPSYFLAGNAFAATPAVSVPVIFRQYIVPVQNAAGSGTWTMDSSVSNNAFGNAMSLTSAGVLTIPGNLSMTGGGITLGGGNSVQFSGRSSWNSSANGALEAKNSSGSIISTVQGNIPMITKTANYVAVVLDSGLCFNNTGAGATNRIDLPTAAAGMQFWFYEDANFVVRAQATGTDVIRDAATVSPAAGGMSLNAVGSMLHLVCIKAGLWVVESKNGTFLGPN